MAKGVKVVKAKCKGCNSKLSIYVNNKFRDHNLLASVDGVDTFIDSCDHQN